MTAELKQLVAVPVLELPKIPPLLLTLLVPLLEQLMAAPLEAAPKIPPELPNSPELVHPTAVPLEYEPKIPPPLSEIEPVLLHEKAKPLEVPNIPPPPPLIGQVFVQLHAIPLVLVAKNSPALSATVGVPDTVRFITVTGAEKRPGQSAASTVIV
jgi:hypothetical protein